MTVEQPTARTRVFNTGLSLYRKTLKRFRPVHIALHWLLTRTLIPIMERSQSFYTMPDDPFWFRLELLSGTHERETSQRFEQIVRPGMTVLDIGAHVGYYSRRFVRLAGPTGRVIAFEPHPRNHSFLQRNLQGFPHVTLMQIALAEKEGSAELYDYLMMSASGSLNYDESLRDVQTSQLGATDFAPRLATGHTVEKFTVRTRAVDDCMRELGIERIDVIKMDIEGAEMGALRGMHQIIRQSPELAMIMEFNPMGLRAFAVDPHSAIADVLALGFQQVQILQVDGSLRDITADPAAIEALTAQLIQNMGVVNLLFTRSVSSGQE